MSGKHRPMPLILAGAVFSLTLTAAAQEIVHDPSTGAASYVPSAAMEGIATDGSTPQEIATDIIGQLADVLRIDDANRQLQLNSTKEYGDITRLAFQQVHNGYTVVDAQVIVTLRDGTPLAISSSFVPDIRLAANAPKLSASEAIETVRRISQTARVVGNRASSGIRTEDRRRDDPIDRIVWLVQLGHDPGDRPVQPLLKTYVVDASDGMILDSVEHIRYARHRIVTDVDRKDSPRREGDPATGNKAIDDAYEAAGRAYDYFETHSHTEWANNEGQINLEVNHAREKPKWGGGGTIKNIAHFRPSVFGGGKIILPIGYVQDDVIYHEYTHGVIEGIGGPGSGLFNRLSVGDEEILNESIADVFAFLIQNAERKPGEPLDWRLGENLPSSLHPPGLSALRNLQKPADTQQPGHTDNYCRACKYERLRLAYINTGIPNRAFAEIVENLDNDLGKAGSLYYRALLGLSNSTAGFIETRQALINSAGADKEKIETALDCVGWTETWEPKRPICVFGMGFGEFCPVLGIGTAKYISDCNASRPQPPPSPPPPPPPPSPSPRPQTPPPGSPLPDPFDLPDVSDICAMMLLTHEQRLTTTPEERTGLIEQLIATYRLRDEIFRLYPELDAFFLPEYLEHSSRIGGMILSDADFAQDAGAMVRQLTPILMALDTPAGDRTRISEALKTQVDSVVGQLIDDLEADGETEAAEELRSKYQTMQPDDLVGKTANEAMQEIRDRIAPDLSDSEAPEIPGGSEEQDDPLRIPDSEPESRPQF